MTSLLPKTGEGLSPLTRGNPMEAMPSALAPGPIPAHAGEPGHAVPDRRPKRAYPRSRGGTARTQCCFRRQWGLSPLTRGNRSAAAENCFCGGPIPAHAGEPFKRPRGQPFERAYPRSRGGTGSWLISKSFRSGLSPLTRGNQCYTQQATPVQGPIPAHAGEPPL